MVRGLRFLIDTVEFISKYIICQQSHKREGICLLLFLFAGALSYAELGTMITKSGAEYAYLQEAFGPFHRVMGQIPSFLFAWTSVLILKPALFGVVSLSFAIYVVQPFFGDCESPVFLQKLIAVLCLCK